MAEKSWEERMAEKAAARRAERAKVRAAEREAYEQEHFKTEEEFIAEVAAEMTPEEAAEADAWYSERGWNPCACLGGKYCCIIRAKAIERVLNG